MVLRFRFFFIITLTMICGLEAVDFTRHSVRNAQARQAVCNDGSPAVYYFRKGTGAGSKNWVIFLGGGGFCYSIQSCNERKREAPELMTSLDKPETFRASGILSDVKSQNPDFYDANQVILPYCSSDLWSGNRESSRATGKHEFRGWRIVRETIEDLKSGSAGVDLDQAKRVLFAGTSAGGVGVMVHIDWLASQLPGATLGGLNDAGWMPEIDSAFVLGPQRLVGKALRLWNGQPDSSCAKANPGSKYKCYLATAFPHLNTPLMVQMSQHDVWVLDSMNIHPPFDSFEKALMKVFSDAVRESLKPVPAAFSPRTMTHGLLPFQNFGKLKIQNHTLREITGNWFFHRAGPVKVIKQ